MPRTLLHYEVADVSAAARSLRGQLQKLQRLPSHVELLNMLARAAGYRNFQHFRIEADKAEAPSSPPVAKAVLQVDRAAVEKAARYFDADGRMMQWPSKDSHARLCLWVIWSRLPAGVRLTDRAISDILRELNAFDDHALLRRALVDYGLVERTPAGSAYRRIERDPPAELEPLLEAVGFGVATAVRGLPT